MLTEIPRGELKAMLGPLLEMIPLPVCLIRTRKAALGAMPMFVVVISPRLSTWLGSPLGNCRKLVVVPAITATKSLVPVVWFSRNETVPLALL